jgi:hypothetical protein
LGIALSYFLINFFYSPLILFGFEFRLPPTNASRMAHAYINTFWDFGYSTGMKVLGKGCILQGFKASTTDVTAVVFCGACKV